MLGEWLAWDRRRWEHTGFVGGEGEVGDEPMGYCEPKMKERR